MPTTRCGTAEDAGGRGDVTGGEGLAHRGRGPALALAHVLERDDLEPEGRAQLAQGLDVAGVAVAEPRVDPDDDDVRLEPVDEGAPDELLRGLPRELGRERQHEQAVDAGGLEEVVAQGAGGDELGARSGCSTATGCGSKVTATVGQVEPAPVSSSWVSTARWPRWTPSKLPMVTTQGRSSSGVAAGSVNRCTLDTLRTRRGEHDVAPGRGAGLVEHRDEGAVGPNAATGPVRPGSADGRRWP